MLPRSGRNRLLLLLLTTLTGAGVFLAVLWSANAHAITPENVARIKPGMTRSEVVALLGASPGNYDGAVFVSIGSEMLFGDEHDVWVSRDASVKVSFDENQRVTEVISGFPVGVNDGWLARCRRWIGI
jgi:hypothetical protein